MSVLQAILLGIIQGITEFLPVSSFGHLAALENAMGISRDTAVLFEVLLHVGTLAAIFMAFQEDIRKIGEEAAGMVLDLIGNANIYFHNRRTGEKLNYAKDSIWYISQAYRFYVGFLYSNSNAWVCMPKACHKGSHFSIASGSVYYDNRCFPSCHRFKQHWRNQDTKGCDL